MDMYMFKFVRKMNIKPTGTMAWPPSHNQPHPISCMSPTM